MLRRKKKCVGDLTKAVLSCYGKSASAGVPVDPECLQKAKTKFDGLTGDPTNPGDPAKGCIGKLEAKPPCLTTGEPPALETRVNDFTQNTFSGLLPHLDFTLGSDFSDPCGSATEIFSRTPWRPSCGGLNIGGGGAIVPEGQTPDGSTSRFSLNCDGTGACQLGPTLHGRRASSIAPPRGLPVRHPARDSESPGAHADDLRDATPGPRTRRDRQP